jgi:hypothetical protein
MTYDLTTLKALKARIDAATGEDRGLDADIAILFGKLIVIIDPNAPDDMKWRIIFPDADYGCGFETGYYDSTKRSKKQLYKEAHDDAQKYEHLERFTSSVDAALALIAKVLPELVIEMCRTSDGKFQVREAWLHIPENEDLDGLEIDHPRGTYRWKPKPASLAILSVLFAALIAKEENNDPR